MTNNDILGPSYFGLLFGSVVVTAILRRYVIGYAGGSPELVAVPPKTAEMGTQTEPDEESPPPPYAEPAALSSEETAPALEVLSEEKEEFQPTTLKTFIIATILCLINIAILVFLAFGTQAMIWCTKNEHPEFSEGYWKGVAFIWWVLYPFVALYANFGVTVWAMTVRDFFGGEEARKKVRVFFSPSVSRQPRKGSYWDFLRFREKSGADFVVVISGRLVKMLSWFLWFGR